MTKIIFLIVSNTFLILGSKINSEKIIIECSIHPVGLNYDLYIITVTSGGDYILKIKSDEKTCTTDSIQLSKADQSGESTVGFDGEMLKGTYDFYFRLDGVDFEKDYDSLKEEIIKQSSYVFDNYGTLQKMYESIIIPIFNGQKELSGTGAEWAFKYLKLCHIVAPQDYDALKSIIIKHIEFLYGRGEPNIADYYPILDSILKDIEES